MVRRRRKAMALVRRAINEDWPLSAEMRQDVLAEAHRLVKDATDTRAQVNAMRVLLAAGQLNVAQARLALDLARHEADRETLARIEELEAALGIHPLPPGTTAQAGPVHAAPPQPPHALPQ